MGFKKTIKIFLTSVKENILFVAIGILVFLAVFLLLFSLLKVPQFYDDKAFSDILSYFHVYNPKITGILLFYDDNCDQCAKVDTFIKNNNIESKVEFTRLDISNNETNKNILADKFQICGINPQDYGVPFLWDGKNCFLGYVDVIKFFQTKISKKQ